MVWIPVDLSAKQLVSTRFSHHVLHVYGWPCIVKNPIVKKIKEDIQRCTAKSSCCHYYNNNNCLALSALWLFSHSVPLLCERFRIKTCRWDISAQRWHSVKGFDNFRWGRGHTGRAFQVSVLYENMYCKHE